MARLEERIGTKDRDPDFRHERAVIAGRARQNPDYRRDRKVEVAANYIRELVDGFPPLTTEQRARLATLLKAESPVTRNPTIKGDGDGAP